MEHGTPGRDPLVKGDVWRRWFLVPPYPGWMLVSIGVLSFIVTVTLLAGPRSRPPAPERVVLAPPVRPTAPPVPPESLVEAPVVTIRPVPERPSPPANHPAMVGTTMPGNGPATVPAAPQPQPGSTPGEIELPPLVLEPDVEAAPAGTPRVETPRGELPRTETPVTPAPPPTPVEPTRPEAPRVEPQRPRPQPRPRVPAYDTGKLAIFFDADSSTFGRHDERLPLRVQVFVDGEMRVDNADPEKREFDLGSLREGRHEVVLVPYVGRATPEPRRYRVDIDPDRTNRFKAVLRREDGVSTISKFRPN